MSKKLGKIVLPKNAHVHVDKVHVVGPLRHRPVGNVKYDYDGQGKPVPSVAFGISKKLKDGNKETVFIASKALTEDGYANKLELMLCPGKVLQKHNAFGHNDILDYTYHAFDHATRKLGIEVSPHDREQWKQGFVWFSEVHLTANFGCWAHYVEPIIAAIDENNIEGKFKQLKTSISLGFGGVRRSRHCIATIYYKLAELEKAWRKTGPYQKILLESLRNAIRCEIKLYDEGLKALGLQYGANWKGVDVAALYFSQLEKFNIKHAIQPLMTPEQMHTLTKVEQKVYTAWLHGTSVKDQFKSRTSVMNHCNSIEEKTGHDLRSNRRPDALPAVSTVDIFCPGNVVPIPQELFGTPYYRLPGQPDLPPLRDSYGQEEISALEQLIESGGQSETPMFKRGC